MSRVTSALREIPRCPLCGDDHIEGTSRALPNLYSEQLAIQLGCEESELLDAVTNRQCETCGLWYKDRWFHASDLQALFTDLVPDHPKGWDAVSDRFSEAGFARELQDYQRALASSSTHEAARHRRTLSSIIDSVVGLDPVIRHQFNQSISQGDCAALAELQPSLEGRFGEPAAFKRFSGFSAPALWAWMESRLGPVRRYGEVGCPLWGQLSRLREASAAHYFFVRQETNYWGSGCCRTGTHCAEKLVQETGVVSAPWPPGGGVQLDAMGAFQYLDHLERPDVFVEEAFQHARALLLIFDSGDAPSAIQHFTGWNDRSVGWLAQHHGKQVVSDFDAIEASGNRAWLLFND